MTRIAREKSQSGIYHVMFRGINRQEIFHDEDDCVRFLETLERYKRQSKLGILSWCLMGNHVHLLVREGDEDLSVTMKRVGVSFAGYYNGKYEHTGHLFQDRYKSEKVESDAYLLTVIRYIHTNPVKAGVVKQAQDWKWSSCRGYYGEKLYPSTLLDDELILELFSSNRGEAIEKFRKYSEEANDDRCLDEHLVRKLTDREAKEEIGKAIKEYSVQEIKTLARQERDRVIKIIKDIDGLTQRQAARILGISPNLIFKA